MFGVENVQWSSATDGFLLLPRLGAQRGVIRGEMHILLESPICFKWTQTAAGIKWTHFLKLI